MGNAIRKRRVFPISLLDFEIGKCRGFLWISSSENQAAPGKPPRGLEKTGLNLG